MSHMQYEKYSNHNSTLPESIWRPRRSIDAINILNQSRVPHTQEKLVSSTCRYKYNKITYHGIHNIIIIDNENKKSYNESDHLHTSVLKE
jgi:hypothetical protein